jgi:hypothetical protein
VRRPSSSTAISGCRLPQRAALGMVADVLIARRADRPDRPLGVDWLQPPTPTAGAPWSWEAAVTDQRAGTAADARPRAPADRADPGRALVAALAQIRAVRGGAPADRTDSSAAAATPLRRPVARLADWSLLQGRLDRRDSAARAADSGGAGVAVAAQRTTVGQPLDRKTLVPAASTLLDHERVVAVAAVADHALGPTGRHPAVLAAAGASDPVPPGVAAAAQPPAGRGPKKGLRSAAGRAHRWADRMPGLDEHMRQPHEGGRAVGDLKGQRSRLDVK